MFHAAQLILTIEIIREFVMSLQVIIYAKENGAQMATFAATGTRADIDDLRKEDNGGPQNEVGTLYLSFEKAYRKISIKPLLSIKPPL